MAEKKITIESLGIKYGLYLFGGLVAYFLIMKLFGLHEVVELRFFNFVILIAAVYSALKYFKKKSGSVLTYFRGIGIGVLTSFVGVIPFAIFIGFYLGFMDQELMQTIKSDQAAYITYINPFSLSFVIALEGMISGFFTTFILMQYLKTSHLENPTE